MASLQENAVASSSNFEEDVKKLMGKGKVHLVCGEFMDAVKCFEEATKMLDQKHGEGADGCGEAYFYYGKSLLEVARMEGGVLGNALQGALDSNTQENGDDSYESGKSAEDKKEKPETSENKTDDDKKKENDLFVRDEIDENEKKKISEEVLDAMIEERAPEGSAEGSSKPEQDTPMEETSESKDEKSSKNTTSEAKEDKASDKPSEAKENPASEMTDDSTAPKGEDSEMKDDVTSDSKNDAKAETKDVEMVGDKKEAEEKDDEKKDDKECKKDDNKEEEKDDNAEEEEGDGDDNEEVDDENMDAEEGEGEGETEEEPTYMELAWQMLEMARIIFSKRDTKEGKLLLAQCHLKLGEIQMEQEQFMGAVEDFLKCMDIQKELLSADDRLIAETAYNIGLAFSFQSMHDKSKDYYTQALDTISLRIKSLQESIDEAEGKSKGKEKATADNPLVANTKELKELQELYPEVQLKVNDAEEMIKQAKNKPDVSSVMSNGGTTTIGFGDSNSSKDQPATMIAAKKKPVAATDITHLVHRNKRKPEEDDSEDTAAKKPRPDPEGSQNNGKPETTNNNGQATTAET